MAWLQWIIKINGKKGLKRDIEYVDNWVSTRGCNSSFHITESSD